jgi:hypothetical protein
MTKKQRREVTADELKGWEWLVEIVDAEELGDWIDKLSDNEWWEASCWIGRIIRKVHKQGLKRGYDLGREDDSEAKQDDQREKVKRDHPYLSVVK